VDGISLTVVNCTSTGFTVSVIPFTAREATIGAKGPGGRVNLECDVIAKYVEKLLGRAGDAVPGEGHGGLDERFLSEHGFA
jgi:riboflavin synthase